MLSRCPRALLLFSFWLLSFWLGLPLLLGTAIPARSQSTPPVSVLTQHDDNQRTGANLNETALTDATVNVNNFGKLFSCPVDGFVYAQPLYVPGVAIAGGTHNVLYVATAHDTVYAFDADNGAQLATAPLGTSVPSSVINTPNIQVEVGIISTPVIDPVTGTMYVVAKTYANQVQQFWLHALDITTLQDKLPPVQITAQVAGTGYGDGNHRDSDGQHVFFVAGKENQRAALTLVNGVLYVAFASHEDYDDYHGWLLAYDASALTQTAAYNTTPNGGRGAIWMSGQGLTADAAGDVYYLTGNSTNSTENNAGDYGESFVKMGLSGSTLSVLDYFKTDNYDSLNSADADLGSGGALLIPGTTDLVGGGKQGLLYVVNTTNMGGLDTSGDRVVQEWQADNGLWGSPIFWNGSAPTLYVWSGNDRLKAYSFSNGLFATTPSSVGAVPISGFGEALSVSSNGSTAGTGIVWATVPLGDPDHATVPGQLYAYDATNLTNELWDSGQNSARDGYGNFAKFCAPTVANGKVYVPTDSKQVAVYGILPPVTAPPPAPPGLTATGGNGLVVLKWNFTNTAASYNVYRGTVSGGEVKISTTPALVTGTTYIDTGLTNGTPYFYYVTAVNTIGESGPSAEATATPAVGTGTVLSLNFVGNGPTPMAATESAGVVAATDWNNAPGVTGSLPYLEDNNGTFSGTSATWSCSNLWAIGLPDTAGNDRMMNGYLDDNSSATTVTVSGLPPALTANGYNVYVYCNGDGTQRSGDYTIGSTTITAQDNARFAGTFVQANGSPGNYVLFPGVTGSGFTLTATATPGGGFRAPVNAIQIVAQPAPTPAITSLSPSSATAGSPGFPLTISGSGFTSSSTVTFNGTALAVTGQTPTQLTATVPTVALATAISATVTVTNAAPGGGSASAPFAVVPAPLVTLSSINAGGPAVGTFAADGYYSGGVTAHTTAAVSTAGVTDPAPQAVYQTERYGNFTYAVPNLTPGAAYTLRLHFTEIYWNSAGQRLFNVSVNGSPFLTNFDVFAAAGGKDKAIVETLPTTADGTGRITVTFTTLRDNAKVSGIEVVGAAPSNTPPAAGTPAYQVNGGGGVVGTYGADADFSGGVTAHTTAAIDTAGVTDPAPQAVYQTERYGNFTYAVPNLTPGAAYTLRLHFTEIYWNSAGKRLFNVSVNGSPFLTNFDVFAAAGGKDKAIVETLPATADGTGRITVTFTTLRDNAKVSGIELTY